LGLGKTGEWIKDLTQLVARKLDFSQKRTAETSKKLIIIGICMVKIQIGENEQRLQHQYQILSIDRVEENIDDMSAQKLGTDSTFRSCFR
jgi:hypothetical protein